VEQFALSEKFFTQSVWGILILGAVGSIVGAFIIYLVKKIFNHINSNKQKYLASFLYKYFIHVNISEKLSCKLHPSQDAKYIAWCISEFSYFICSFLSLGLLLFFTAIVVLFFGIDRPILLSVLISIIILLVHFYFKSLVSTIGLIDDNIWSAYKEIKNSQSTNYDEFEKSCKEKS
jgi:ABC-type multidrug transport system fused ATPase/permease subunit